MIVKRAFAFLAVVSLSLPCFADIILYQDLTMPGPQTALNAGMQMTNVSTGPAINPSHPDVGAVNLVNAAAFSSFSPVTQPAIPNVTGPFTWSVDVYIPNTSTLRATPEDTLYLQMGSDVNGNFASGAFGNRNNLPIDQWFTMSISFDVSDIPAGSTTLNPLFIVGDFVNFANGNGVDGTAFYVDNAVLSAIPEPTAFGVLALGSVVLGFRRRK